MPGLDNVENGVLLQTIREEKRTSEGYELARQEVDRRVGNKSNPHHNKGLLHAKMEAIQENMGVSTQKAVVDQLIKEVQDPTALDRFEQEKADKQLAASVAIIEERRREEKDLLAKVQAMDRSLSVVEPTPSVERGRSSSEKATAELAELQQERPSVFEGQKQVEPAQGAEKTLDELQTIVGRLNETAKDPNLGLYIGKGTAKEFKEKMEEINTGLGGRSDEHKPAFLKFQLGELDKFCDSKIEKVETSGFKKFANVIKNAFKVVVSSVKGGEEHKKNKLKFNQSCQEFSDGAGLFKENLKGIKDVVANKKEEHAKPQNPPRLVRPERGL